MLAFLFEIAIRLWEWDTEDSTGFLLPSPIRSDLNRSP